MFTTHDVQLDYTLANQNDKYDSDSHTVPHHQPFRLTWKAAQEEGRGGAGDALL